MRLLYTDTGLNNPLLPVYSLTAAEIALANLNPTIWSPATVDFIKPRGSGKKFPHSQTELTEVNSILRLALNPRQNIMGQLCRVLIFQVLRVFPGIHLWH